MQSRRSDNGLFLTVEGGEGTGKSTLIERLFTFLTEQEGHFVVKSFEPGGTPFGRMIRDIVLNHDEVPISPRSELFLYLADRAQHIETLIKPSLNQDMIVLCDRFNDSSVAYQGAAREDPNMEKVIAVCNYAAEGLAPDLTLYLDLDPKVGLSRLKGEPDRLENEHLEFHQRVRDGYIKIARDNPDRVVVLDAALSSDDVYNQAQEKILEKMKLYGIERPSNIDVS